ncbi:Transaldolase B [BD1-7 clade bacterium]|uniref:Transaldolase n=1 Tax=BD1-7 clade bacterium TaxID=2029982 RepID=A0A5S9QVC4_9GAMM|nr:Transaldolase B [BD1-7 clade bacterium]CAA0122638.1 Transaldolase B [BD1-7 clade bacterium]
MNKLEQLKAYSTVVADTGDMQAIERFKPLDATTNPSLLLKASALDIYQPLLTQAIDYARTTANTADSSDSIASLACDKLATLIGGKILNIIDGRISTEVDARLSFDTRATIEKARLLIRLYEEAGIDKSRILIKIASTWEGIQAASVLEKEGINTNLTLLFSLEQAQACADAGAFLISPFVGRILDWYKAANPNTEYTVSNDPGVASVRSIFDYYKENHIETVIMGASFRSAAQVEALAGCDRLTISPALLEALQNDEGTLEQTLKAPDTTSNFHTAIEEAQFRYALNTNAMATEKLADGIRLFARDQATLEQQLQQSVTTGE